MNLKVVILKPMVYSLVSFSKAFGVTLILARKFLLSSMDERTKLSSLRKCKDFNKYSRAYLSEIKMEIINENSSGLVTFLSEGGGEHFQSSSEPLPYFLTLLG